MHITRTYPTPDTQRENCGPRERALATFKYLMGLEPEEAIKHPRFALMVNAFEQQRILGQRELIERHRLTHPCAEDDIPIDVNQVPYLVEPLVEELTTMQQSPLRRAPPLKDIDLSSVRAGKDPRDPR